MCFFLVSLLLVLVPPAWSLTTVTCPGGPGCVGDDYVVPQGEHHTGLYIRLASAAGKVILQDHATLSWSQVRGLAAHQHGPCVALTGVTHATVMVVDIFGRCGAGSAAALEISSSTANVWGVKVRGSASGGFWFENSTVEAFGLFSTGAQGTGVHIDNSSVIMTALVYAGQNQEGLHVASNSQVRLVRSRARYNGGIFHVEQPGSLTKDSVCDTPIGETACSPDDYGDPLSFPPRLWTVCLPGSFQGDPTGCDFLTPQEALAAPEVEDGDILIVDSPSGLKTWGDITVDKSVSLIGAVCGNWFGGRAEQCAAKGTYSYTVPARITITAPNVRVFFFTPAPGTPEPPLDAQVIWYE